MLCLSLVTVAVGLGATAWLLARVFKASWDAVVFSVVVAGVLSVGEIVFLVWRDYRASLSTPSAPPDPEYLRARVRQVLAASVPLVVTSLAVLGYLASTADFERGDLSGVNPRVLILISCVGLALAAVIHLILRPRR